LPRRDGRQGSSADGPSVVLADLSDKELLDGIRKASEPHFSELYNRYFGRIYAFVHGRIRNHADAEEIAQEAFITVFRSIDSYRGQSSLLSWIFGIAKNLSNNTVRRAASRQQKLDALDPVELNPLPSFATATPEEQLHLQRFTAAIRERLNGMAGWQRRIFEMRHLENMSIPEIAKRTERSNDAVRSSLYRIKRMMLDQAEDQPSEQALQ
jgi:RNA polymerase sigma-70 factor (ECF subfamily)